MRQNIGNVVFGHGKGVHCTGGGLAHEFAAHHNKAQGIFKGHDACDASCDIFTDTMSSQT